MPHNTYVYAASEPAFLVNSFLLEGTDSVVAIDAQFLISSAKALRERLDGIGKSLAALILTHPHPDHYNGAATVLVGLGAVPILATEATDAGIRASAEAKRAYWTPRYGENYPQNFLYPNRILTSGETVTFGGISLKIDDIGPGEASNIVVIHAPETRELFASDLIYSACHPWLAEERSDLWLAQLDMVKARYSDVAVVHAGHGVTKDLTLIDAQKAYIRAFRKTVEAQLGGSGLAEGGKAIIHKRMTEQFPGYPLEFLIDLNTDAMVNEVLVHRCLCGLSAL
jgi:glyoxylase-like metal-dependent hydrolase (beta-lactamase superfamily II)